MQTSHKPLAPANACLKLERRRCEERSDEAIHSFFAWRDGLLRCARNDGAARWIASRSLLSGANARPVGGYDASGASRREAANARLVVVASEAKQSILSLRGAMDCFAALAMTVSVARSGRIEARSGLRMMPTFPRSPLSFRTAGFPQYGWKAGFSDGAFLTSTRA